MSIYGKDAYFRKYNLRFIFAPKTGWTSLRNSDVDFIWEDPKRLPEDCVNFSVYRDPYERFKSGYKEVIGKPIREEPDLGKNINIDKYIEIQREIRKYSFGSISSIEAYINSIHEFGVWDGHQISYVNSLSDPKRGRENLDINKIIFLDFKNLKLEFNSLIGKNIIIPHLQKGLPVNKDNFLEFKNQIDDLINVDNMFLKNKILNIKNKKS